MSPDFGQLRHAPTYDPGEPEVEEEPVFKYIIQLENGVKIEASSICEVKVEENTLFIHFDDIEGNTMLSVKIADVMFWYKVSPDVKELPK